MKNQKILLVLSLLLFSIVTFSQDVEGCKDNPMFPNRMSNYLISECVSNFDAVDFNLDATAEKTISKEGTKIAVRYDFNAESGKQKPSPLQILRNYENAVKKIGGVTVYIDANQGTGVFKIIKDKKKPHG